MTHPVEDRPLSVQEYKRLQEFPDDWELCGSIVQRYKQIGNAVPVSVGETIGKEILRHFAGQQPKEYPGFRYSRYKATSNIEFVHKLEKLAKKKEGEKGNTQLTFNF